MRRVHADAVGLGRTDVLVPLVAKGYLRRANTLPYIAGANITTLADTLVAAILLGNQDAVRVVVAVDVVGRIVVTLVVLAFFYPLLRRFCLGVAHQRPRVSRSGSRRSSRCSSWCRWP